MGWNAALFEYATAQRAAGRSPGTIKLHQHYLRNVAELGRSPWTITRQQLLGYLAREGWKPETRRSARSAVRSFYRWAHGMGYVLEDPADQLPTVRVPAGRPRPTPELLVQQLVHHSDRRLALMGMLAAYAGLRAAEIARVHGRDLLGDELTVLGKGGKVRVVPIVHRRLLRELQHLQRRDAWAFPNGLGTHMTPGHVSRLLSAALPDGWTAHTLRHRMATTAYHGTRDLLAVGALLGHSRPETTQRYVLMPDDALRAAVRAAAAS